MYAAYGSNMDPAQMAQRAPHSPQRGTGWLQGWRLTFGGEQIGWEGALATVVEAEREIREGHLARVLFEELRIVHGGERMQVGDEVKRLLVVLQLNMLADRAEIIAPMGKPGGLDAGENAH